MTEKAAYDVDMGDYRPCRTCGAPIVDPFPAEWTIDLIKEGPRWGAVKLYYTPHAEQCDAPTPTYTEDTGICVRIPGHYVTGIDVCPPPVPPAATTRSKTGYVFIAPTGGPDWTGWVPLGTTTDGIQVTGPLYRLDGVWPVHLDGDDTE